jgi:phosphoribosylanthranilate isomerase
MSTVAAQQKAPGRNLFWRMPEFYWVFSARTIVDREELMRDSVRSFEHWRRESAPDLEVPGGDGNQPSNGKYPSQPVIFFDAGTHDRPGGTGTTFDWKAAAPLVESLRGRAHFVVAGGLNPSNVATAMRVLDPFGVDVASGVEARPGKKDPEKVRAFVQAVRAADRKVG